MPVVRGFATCQMPRDQRRSHSSPDWHRHLPNQRTLRHNSGLMQNRFVEKLGCCLEVFWRPLFEAVPPLQVKLIGFGILRADFCKAFPFASA